MSIKYLFKWFLLLIIVSVVAGTLSAFFLTALNFVTSFRDNHQYLIYFLPLAGLLIGFIYHHYGKTVERGNNLVFDTIHSPKDVIPLKMSVLVLIGTLVTHLFGGSAGREGTALQMSASAADQLHTPFKLSTQERVLVIIAALSAGFGSVFGTPLAGAIFGIEVLLIAKFPYKAIVPAVIAAYSADYITKLWGTTHTTYSIGLIPTINLVGLGAAALAGIFFGLSALLFVILTHQVSSVSKLIKYPPARPFVGGIIVAVLVIVFALYKLIGLGIPSISEAFRSVSAPQDFLLKIALTALTLGFGFKGGEVTPLFFIGATLGSALAIFLPLPVGLLAGMGFVAVFAGAAKTPLACIAMSAELFGLSACIYISIACVVSYFISGSKSIYNVPQNRSPRHFLFGSPALFY
ncbi:chloride channel protein [Pedobacter sp. PWIIR3]